MLEQRIRQHFYDAADALVQMAEEMSRPLAAAVDLSVAAVTAGGRLLFAGTGSAQADALHAAALLCGAAERARPALPALALGADSATLSALASSAGDVSAGLARQIQALGMPGDVLVLFEGHLFDGQPGMSAALDMLVKAAHDREMSVILWGGAPVEGGPAPTAELLTDTDVFIPLRADRLSHRSALVRLGWHWVADAIDAQLLGEPS